MKNIPKLQSSFIRLRELSFFPPVEQNLALLVLKNKVCEYFKCVSIFRPWSEAKLLFSVYGTVAGVHP